MIKDLLKISENVSDLEQVVLDNYKLEDGVYFKITKESNIEVLCVDNDTSEENKLYQWFKLVDYYSGLIAMNKSVDSTKKIHSNNMFSLFIKCDILPEIGTNKDTKKLINTYKELDDIIDNYFSILKNPNLGNKERLLIEKYAMQEIDSSILDYNKDTLKEKIRYAIEYIKSNRLIKKKYLKIFIEEDVIKYKEESQRYLIPRVFNKNDYNVNIDNKILGLSNNNMSLNSKKPYLKFNTRYEVPFRVTLEDALRAKLIFDWLNTLQKSDEEKKYILKSFNMYIPLDYNFKNVELNEKALSKSSCVYLYKGMNNGKTEIQDFEIIKNLEKFKLMIISNYLYIEDFEEQGIVNLFQLEEEIDKNFYNNKLRYNYYNDEIKNDAGKFSKREVNILKISKNAMLNYFKKNNKLSFVYCIDKITKELILEKFLNKKQIYLKEIKYAMNFRLNLLNYYEIEGKNNMGDNIQEIYNKLKDKVNTKEIITCESTDEFYFAAGQLISYLVSKSESQNRYHDLTVPFLQISNDKKLKESISSLFLKYSHAVSRNNYRINNLLAMVMGYSSNSKVKDYTDMLISGICTPNILYIKKEEDNNNGK